MYQSIMWEHHCLGYLKMGLRAHEKFMQAEASDRHVDTSQEILAPLLCFAHLFMIC